MQFYDMTGGIEIPWDGIGHVPGQTFNQSQHDIVTEEIDKLLIKGFLKVSSPEPGEFVSPIFLRPKPDRSHPYDT